MRDLVVVGGGPAGLAAAIAAADAGLRVTVFERRRGVIDKACGEGLMPGALAHLSALGVGVLAGHRFDGICYADAVDPVRVAVGRFAHGPGRGVRRAVLHEALRVRAAALGVELEEGVRVEALRQHDDHVVAHGLPARWLIAADGLHSPLRHSLGLARAPRRPPRFGVRRHFRCAPWSDQVIVYWSPHAEAYVTPVGAECVGVALLFEPPGRFETLLEAFPRLRERLGAAPAVTPVRGAGPFEQRVSRRVVGQVLLCGDAAGYLDPLTGEGVALGVATARAAVACVVEGVPERYERAWQQTTWRYFALTRLLLDLGRRAWLRRNLVGLMQRAPWLFEGALRFAELPRLDAVPRRRLTARAAR